MKIALWAKRTVCCRRPGITLIEVLFAIFIVGVGLLALLTLFPLGVLELAQDIRDDRAGKLAIDAVALGEAGADLLSRTEEFIAASLASGKADAQRAAGLRANFESLKLLAEDIETRLVELNPLIRKGKLRRQYLVLLTQIDAIQCGINEMIDLLTLLEEPNLPP
jgi:prepilin-type N-terminal cleavage/methylation domain-containing protein